MVAILLNIAEIKAAYPNEWVLIGDPLMSEDGIDVLAGVPIYHSQDKKEVCYIGRDKTSDFEKITLIYTGILPTKRKWFRLVRLK